MKLKKQQQISQRSKRQNILPTLLIFGLLQAACTTGSCRQQERIKKELERTGNKSVRVFKYDGSKQCAGGGEELDKMAKELEPVKPLSMSKKSDGMMRTQVCGNDTGMANVYEVTGEDLPEAEKKGFRVWSFD